MNVLIVHAHPEPQSFTAALRDKAVETFQAQGHQVQVSDLYAMNWNPVASADDFGARENPEYLVYALEQRLEHLSDDQPMVFPRLSQFDEALYPLA